MAMTKRDKDLIAQVINSVGRVENAKNIAVRDTLEAVAETFAATFALQNDKFDPLEFKLKAMALDEDEVSIPPAALIGNERD